MKTLKVNEDREKITVADFIYVRVRESAERVWDYLKANIKSPRLTYDMNETFHCEVISLDKELDLTLCDLYESRYGKDYVGEYKGYCMLFNVIMLNFVQIMEIFEVELCDSVLALVYPFEVDYRYCGKDEYFERPTHYEVALTIPYQVDDGLLEEMQNMDSKTLKEEWGIDNRLLKEMTRAKREFDLIGEEGEE